eukprot:SAG31_NODE_4449_length_3222_cov_1.382325_1_plen_212_part_00
MLLRLAQAGFPAEKVHGWWRVLLLYVLSGLLGNMVSSIFLPTSVTVGASGAVFGLFGAMWGDFCQNYNLYKGGRCRQVCSLVLMTAINLGFGAVIPMIDNFAHAGGFITGVLCGLFFFAKPRAKRRGRTKCSQKCLAWLAGLLLGAYIVVLNIMLWREVNSSNWCSWCNLITCLPLNRVFSWFPFTCNNNVENCQVPPIAPAPRPLHAAPR